ncbi:MAG: DUF5000 domain-containing lipoprotein [Carboxylicivirga sp.]|nr:DUF5000 domain-containing lipoprotein [Carboxylicivirga sp.]
MRLLNNILVAGCLILAMLFTACQEDERKPHGDDTTPPGKVTVGEIVNTAGGAIINFDSPSDVDLLYVQASFIDNNNKKRNVKTSGVNSSLEIEGIGAVGDYTVSMVAVDRNENASEVVECTISPLTPPVQSVLPTLTGTVDYGGIKVGYTNEDRATIALNLTTFDEVEGKMMFRESFYTTQESGSYSFRGYDSEPTKFGVYIEDRWGNISDTTIFELTPIPDEYLDKSKFSIFRIQGDKDWGAQESFYAEHMWDDVTNSQWNCSHTDFSTSLPHYLTIDLGQNVKLSRFKLFQRTGDELYKHGNPKVFNVYGTKDVNDLPAYDADEPNAGWTFLSHFESFKPSGLPVGQTTTEDLEYQIKGEDFEFNPDDLVEIRYIRFEITENWGGQNVSVIGELSFWGEILGEN